MIAWVALIALGLHSLIPVGYMPDFSGRGLLVICDGIDHQAVSGHDPHAGHTAHEHGSHNNAGVCPFSVGATYSVEGIKAPLIPPPVYAVAVIVYRTPLLFTQDLNFGNGSPRSPPFFS